jgi:hypothetical protein
MKEGGRNMKSCRRNKLRKHEKSEMKHENSLLKQMVGSQPWMRATIK